MWTGTWLEVNGCRIFAHQAGGEGSVPLLFIHGWTGNSYQWRRVVPRLTTRVRAIVPDLPGCGQSDKPPIDYTIRELVTFIRGFLATEGIDRAVLVGTSFGGFLALRYCLEFPEMVSALILLNASGIRARYSWGLNACSVPVLRYAMPYVMLVPRELKLWIRSKIGSRREAIAIALEEFRDATLTLRSWAGLQASLKSIRNIRDEDMVDDRLSCIACPVLIVWGDRDEALPVEMAHRYHEGIKGSELTLLAGCGHNIPEERPEETVAAIEDFLARRL